MKQFENIASENMENHILPFLWVHGTESEEELLTEVAKIRESGIGAFCVEARPHKDFNGPGWFADLELLLNECKKYDMEMWILDDSHFPTGFADGAVKKYHPELQKQFIYCKLLDFAGPMPHAAALLKYALRTPKDEILSLRLYKKTGFETIDPKNFIDLTGTEEWVSDANTGTVIKDFMGNPLPGEPKHGKTPLVNFDIPEGEWTLAIVAKTFKGGEKETAGYLNPIDADATQILLDTVYQPIYDRFSDEFGKHIRGFFSDEPRFGNIHGAEGASIGRNSSMDLPWKNGLEIQLKEELKGTALENEDPMPLLPLLFIEGSEGFGEEAAHILRYSYMQLVSRLYSECFDGVIAAWCRAHNCEHIGHTIEDNNASARLGYGAGHFFRAMEHQDMAGIDVVIQQLLPGQDGGMFKGMHSPGWDGEFFTYVLGKLGASLAHLDPKKQGRCMVELFGAYGWGEGNRLGKWLTDYFLVRGVNHFVPHAFDPAPFPDVDCPPHFYAHGHNPQYPEFKYLMKYMNTMSNVLAGKHAAPAALLYHAEGEWSGEYMLTQKPAAIMARNMIDYDIVPADYLIGGDVTSSVLTENGSLQINEETFKALVVPYAEALPAALLGKISEYAKKGFPVYFVGGLPVRTSEGIELPDLSSVKTVSLEDLAETLIEAHVPELTVTEKAEYLRYYHAVQEDGDVYFFTNEGLTKITTEVKGAVQGDAFVFDPFTGEICRDENAFSISLEPYESLCVFVPSTETKVQDKKAFAAEKTEELSPETISFADADGLCLQWSEKEEYTTFAPVNNIPGKETFAGRIRYGILAQVTGQQAESRARLVIEGVQEGAAVTVNGKAAGTRICPPYIYDVTGLLQEGTNEIVLEVNTTLGRRMNDFLSQFMPTEALGIWGGVRLETEE